MSNLNPFGGGLQYLGTRASQPPNCHFNKRPPTTFDTNASLMDLWLDVPNNGVYILVSLRGTPTSGGIRSTWVPISVGEVGVFKMQGNTNGPINPSPAGLMTLLGANPLTVTGDPGTATLTISGEVATTSQLGFTTLANDAITIGGTDDTHAVTPDSLTAKLGVQTVNTIPYGTGTNMAIGWTGTGTVGQVLTSNGGGTPPSFQNTGLGVIYAIQTTDAAPTALASFPVAENTAITLVAEIVGAVTGFAVGIGGTALATARRAGGALTLIGAPIVSLNEDSGGVPDFTITINANDLIVQVAGEAATTYNWSGLVRTITVPVV